MAKLTKHCRKLGDIDYVGFGAAEGVKRASTTMLSELPKTRENAGQIIGWNILKLAALTTQLAINRNACNPIYLDNAESNTKTLP
jgi:hypothetical protein